MNLEASHMIDQKDFVPKTISTHWLKGVSTESFDSAVEAAGHWIDSEKIDVINIETVVLPMDAADNSEMPSIPGIAGSLRQFIRVWFRR